MSAPIDWLVLVGGMVCLYLGLSFLGMCYMSVRSRYWPRVNGWVVAKYETISRSHEDEFLHDAAGVKVENRFPAVSVEICLNKEIIRLHFPNPKRRLGLGDSVVVCVHSIFPRLFYCQFESNIEFSWLRAAGAFVVFVGSVILLVGAAFAFWVAFGFY